MVATNRKPCPRWHGRWQDPEDSAKQPQPRFPGHPAGAVMNNLRDRTLHKQGFRHFRRSAVVSHGKAIIFEYPSGLRYRVPVDYLVGWFDPPSDLGTAKDDLRIVKSRKLSEPQLVRVYLSDGRRLDVAWDTVLMACEPSYEHFGGLTQYSQELSSSWGAEEGCFRLP